MTREKPLGQIFDRGGPLASAEVLDDLPLLGGKPADAFLIVRRHFVNHLEERPYQGVDIVTRDELGQDDVNPVVTPDR